MWGGRGGVGGFTYIHTVHAYRQAGRQAGRQEVGLARECRVAKLGNGFSSTLMIYTILFFTASISVFFMCCDCFYRFFIVLFTVSFF